METYVLFLNPFRFGLTSIDDFIIAKQNLTTETLAMSADRKSSGKIWVARALNGLLRMFIRMLLIPMTLKIHHQQRRNYEFKIYLG